MPRVVDNYGNVKYIMSGITSGQVYSGAITGQAGGGNFNIASGTINKFNLAPNAIASGNLASGTINQFTFYDDFLFGAIF